MDTRKLQDTNVKNIDVNVNMKMLGLFGPSKHSTTYFLDSWIIKDIFFSPKSKMK